MSTEIEIVHGNTRRYTLSDITDDDGQDVDLSTGTLSFIVKEYVNAPTSLFVKLTGDGITLDDTIINQAELEITAADLIDADIPNDWRTLPYQISFLRDGERQTPLKGVLRITPGFDEEES